MPCIYLSIYLDCIIYNTIHILCYAFEDMWYSESGGKSHISYSWNKYFYLLYNGYNYCYSYKYLLLLLKYVLGVWSIFPFIQYLHSIHTRMTRNMKLSSHSFLFYRNINTQLTEFCFTRMFFKYSVLVLETLKMSCFLDVRGMFRKGMMFLKSPVN